MGRCQLGIAAAQLILRHTEDKAVEAVCLVDAEHLQKDLRRDGCRRDDSVLLRIVQHGAVLQNQREPEGQSAQNRHDGKARACGRGSQRETCIKQSLQNRGALIGDRDIGLQKRSVKIGDI